MVEEGKIVLNDAFDLDDEDMMEDFMEWCLYVGTMLFYWLIVEVGGEVGMTIEGSRDEW